MAADEQYDAGTTAEDYVAGSAAHADEDAARLFLRRQLESPPRSGNVLDIGCGNGLDLMAYSSIGLKKLFGIDPSQKFIADARRTLGNLAEVQEGTFEKIPYADDSFDAVVSRFALHYSNDIPRSYTEVARVLKQGGVFALVVSHPCADALETPDADDNISITLFGGSVRISFPQHRLGEYFSDEFLRTFDVKAVYEYCGHEQDRGANGLPNALCFAAIKR